MQRPDVRDTTKHAMKGRVAMTDIARYTTVTTMLRHDNFSIMDVVPEVRKTVA